MDSTDFISNTSTFFCYKIGRRNFYLWNLLILYRIVTIAYTVLLYYFSIYPYDEKTTISFLLRSVYAQHIQCFTRYKNNSFKNYGRKSACKSINCPGKPGRKEKETFTAGQSFVVGKFLVRDFSNSNTEYQAVFHINFSI